MPSNHVIWREDLVRGACSLDGMTGFADDWKLLYGQSVAGEFPAAARFAMNPDYPRNVLLTDSLRNLDRLIVASQRLRELIEASGATAIEYLPAPVFNHKKRPVADPYSIVHMVEPVDCLVHDACEPEIDRISKKYYGSVKRLVIDESKIPPDRLLFRPHLYYRAILVHRSLAQKIDDAGMTGMQWMEIADYPPV